MIDLKGLVENLEIKNEYKDLLQRTISAELFTLNNFYTPTIEISKSQDDNDKRVYCKVKICFTNQNSIFLYQCRPFIDKGVIMTMENDTIIMCKTYYLYDEN